MSSQVQARGVIDLPIAGTKGAPRKFKGQSSEVRQFLQHYERLCAKHGVTNDKEKIESITQYCSQHVREFLEGLKSYQGANYDNFKKDLKEFYNADKDSRRFRVRDLEAYVKKTRTQPPMKDLHAWRKYARGYIRIGGWLERKKKIDSDECATYFWKGIPRKFRERLEHRLMSQTPTHDISKPFSISDIEKVAKTLLQHDRFDSERLPSDDEEDSDTDDESTDSDSESSDSDSDSNSDSDHKKKRKSHSKKSKKQKKKKRVTFDSDIDSDSDASDSDSAKATKRKSKAKKTHKATAAKSESNDNKEVEQLIEQLNKMSIHDPSYATLYFRAVSKNSHVRDIVRRPMVAFDQSRPTGTQAKGFSRDAPPHIGTTMGGTLDSPCYGCGESGHGVGSCPRLQEMLRQNIIMRGNNGRYRMANGDRIIRQSATEPLAVAAARQQPTQANYVAYGIATCETDMDEDEFNEAYPCYIPEGNAVLEQVTTDSDSESGYDYQCDSSESEAEVYPIAEPVRQLRSARKELEGVFVPGRKVHDKKLGRTEARESKMQDEAPKRPAKTTARPNFLAPPTPIEVHQPAQIDVNDSDVFMEDNFAKSKSKTDQTRKATTQPEANAKPKSAQAPKNDGNATEREHGDKRLPRISDIQAQTNMNDVMNKIMKASVTMEVGEILGVSKEVAHQVAESLKPRSGTRANAKPAQKATAHASVLAASFVPKARGTLIKLVLECDGQTLNAILDTGSQLNIVNKKYWKSTVGHTRPTDITKQISMTDANGGEGVLTGFIPNVPLRCGGVLTHASIFVGENAPFQLLLGRPWQRGNFVGIDERLDGTYLLFKNRQMEVQYEMFVTPDMSAAHDPEIAHYLAKTGSLTNYMVRITHELQEPNNEGSQVEEFSEEGLETPCSDVDYEQPLDTLELRRRISHLHMYHSIVEPEDVLVATEEELLSKMEYDLDEGRFKRLTEYVDNKRLCLHGDQSHPDYLRSRRGKANALSDDEPDETCRLCRLIFGMYEPLPVHGDPCERRWLRSLILTFKPYLKDGKFTYGIPKDDGPSTWFPTPYARITAAVEDQSHETATLSIYSMLNVLRYWDPRYRATPMGVYVELQAPELDDELPELSVPMPVPPCGSFDAEGHPNLKGQSCVQCRSSDEVKERTYEEWQAWVADPSWCRGCGHRTHETCECPYWRARELVGMLVRDARTGMYAERRTYEAQYGEAAAQVSMYDEEAVTERIHAPIVNAPQNRETDAAGKLEGSRGHDVAADRGYTTTPDDDVKANEHVRRPASETMSTTTEPDLREIEDVPVAADRTPSNDDDSATVLYFAVAPESPNEDVVPEKEQNQGRAERKEDAPEAMRPAASEHEARDGRARPNVPTQRIAIGSISHANLRQGLLVAARADSKRDHTPGGELLSPSLHNSSATMSAAPAACYAPCPDAFPTSAYFAVLSYVVGTSISVADGRFDMARLSLRDAAQFGEDLFCEVAPVWNRDDSLVMQESNDGLPPRIFTLRDLASRLEDEAQVARWTYPQAAHVYLARWECRPATPDVSYEAPTKLTYTHLILRDQGNRAYSVAEYADAALATAETLGPSGRPLRVSTLLEEADILRAHEYAITTHLDGPGDLYARSPRPLSPRVYPAVPHSTGPPSLATVTDAGTDQEEEDDEDSPMEDTLWWGTRRHHRDDDHDDAGAAPRHEAPARTGHVSREQSASPRYVIPNPGFGSPAEHPATSRPPSTTSTPYVPRSPSLHGPRSPSPRALPIATSPTNDHDAPPRSPARVDWDRLWAALAATGLIPPSGHDADHDPTSMITADVLAQDPAEIVRAAASAVDELEARAARALHTGRLDFADPTPPAVYWAGIASPSSVDMSVASSDPDVNPYDRLLEKDELALAKGKARAMVRTPSLCSDTDFDAIVAHAHRVSVGMSPPASDLQALYDLASYASTATPTPSIRASTPSDIAPPPAIFRRTPTPYPFDDLPYLPQGGEPIPDRVPTFPASAMFPGPAPSRAYPGPVTQATALSTYPLAEQAAALLYASGQATCLDGPVLIQQRSNMVALLSDLRLRALGAGFLTWLEGACDHFHKVQAVEQDLPHTQRQYTHVTEPGFATILNRGDTYGNPLLHADEQTFLRQVLAMARDQRFRTTDENILVRDAAQAALNFVPSIFNNDEVRQLRARGDFGRVYQYPPVLNDFRPFL
ncbi:hypothetical protein EIP86_006651 [Pleurotus ostreatoroseus]|nr:hypothetical protein EIP86_006651 [Pleurotus ostreatoroseus]